MSRGKKKTTDKVSVRSLWARLDVEGWTAVLKSAGLDKVQPRGRSIRALCPAHGERTPSFNVMIEDGYARCFGCEYVTRDPIGLISRARDLDYVEAAQWLAETASIRVLDKGTIETLGEAHARRLGRRRAVELACDLLAEAIGLWRDDGPELGEERERPMQMAGLWSALTTIEWMRARRFGVAPGEVATPDRVRHVWQALARERLIGFLPPRALYLDEDRDLVAGYYRAFGEVQVEDLGKPIMP